MFRDRFCPALRIVFHTEEVFLCSISECSAVAFYLIPRWMAVFLQCSECWRAIEQ